MTSRALALCLLLALVACGGRRTHATRATAAAHVATPQDRLLALLPQGAQVVIEVDLARLRANPVVGALVARVLGAGTLPDIAGVPTAPLGTADRVVLASYGVGTAQAATVTLIEAKAEIPGARPITDGVWGLGPPEWIEPIENRAALAAAGVGKQLAPPEDLLALRDLAIPKGAPGSSLRVTARLGFDARVSLARQTGLDSAPAQLSLWGDVIDDAGIVLEADATDPGDKATKQAVARLEAAMQAALRALAAEPLARALGLTSTIASARITVHGRWVRCVIAIGPDHLKRVVERANTLLR
jgi:hypothetical protein